MFLPVGWCLFMFTRFQFWRATVGLSIVLTIGPEPGQAVDPDRPTTGYLRTTFTVEDGLSSNVVNTILQTQNGLLWIGTDAGLNRFDGRRFKPLYFRGPKSTPQGIVSSLAEGPDGDLWIGTSAGLFRIPKRALDQFDRSQSILYHPGTGNSDEIESLHFSRDGTLWVGTSAGLYRFVDNQFKNVIPNSSISRVEESVDGHLLIVSSQGFIELEGTRVVDHPGLAHVLGIRGDGFFHVFQDRKGVLWLSTASGLVRSVNGSFEQIQPYGPGGHGVLRVHEDSQGNLWVAGSTSEQSKGGIFRLSGNKLESLAPAMQVRAISTDREGNLWLGTNGEGLVRFKDRPIRIFTKADGLPNNVAMTVLSKRDGSIWVGNNCGGLSFFNGKRFKTYDEKDGLSNSCVWALAEGKSGELWIGTWGGGLFRFADGHFVQFDLRQGLADNVVRSIAIAHDGSLWIATENGLSHMVDGKFRNYTTTDGLSSNRVVSVYRDRRGDIWVGTSRGINRLTGDRLAPVLSPHEIFDPRYISLAEDSSGELYALSAPKGIDRIEGNQLVEVNHDLDLLSMITSPSGEFWFTGGNGIFRFSEAAFRQHQADRQSPPDYALFGKADGMISTQCSIGAPNMALAFDGKLWVATVQGLAMLDLPHLSFDSAKPAIFVEDVTVGRTRQPAGRELVLPPGTHHVELHFDSISLASPEKIRFQYRMDDVDPVWLDAENSLTAVYTNIPVGTHAFRIRASNSSGVWDRSGISFPVTEEPYFYETAWFRVLAVTVFVVILTGAYRLRLHQIRAQTNARLDERVLERTRVARDLHDTLLQSFQGTLLHFQTGISLLPEHPTEAQETLQKAMHQAADAIGEGREAIQGLRSSVVEANDLAVAVRTLGEELAVGDSVAFHVKEEGAPRKLHPILRDEVYRITGEAMRNAFCHADANQIEVEIHYDDRRLRVRVRDDGKGIDPEMLSDDEREGHFGLRGMKERAKLIGSMLAVWSEVQAGTEVDLTVPAKLAYSSPNEGWRTWLAEKFLARLPGRGTVKNP
jgi:signal transduction histidine kinase/ligand-binding sensor domain-containing protein